MSKYYLSHTALLRLSTCNYYFYSVYINNKNQSDILKYVDHKEDDEIYITSDAGRLDKYTSYGSNFHGISDIYITIYNTIKNYLPDIKLKLLDQNNINIFRSVFSNLLVDNNENDIMDVLSKTNGFMFYFILLSTKYFNETTSNNGRSPVSSIINILTLLNSYTNLLPQLNEFDNMIVSLSNNMDIEVMNAIINIIYFIYIELFNEYIISLRNNGLSDSDIKSTKSAFASSDIVSKIKTILSNIAGISNNIIAQYLVDIDYVYSERNIVSNTFNISNVDFVFYGILDFIIKIGTKYYVIDYKTGNPRFVKLYPDKDISISNQLLLYIFILINLDKSKSEINVNDLSLDNINVAYYFTNNEFTIASFEPKATTNDAIMKFKTELENSINNMFINCFYDKQNKLLMTSIGEREFNIDNIIFSEVMINDVHKNCCFKSKCQYSNETYKTSSYNLDLDEEISSGNIKLVSIDNTMINKDIVKRVPGRIGIINLDYYDCSVVVYLGNREEVINNKESVISLNQSGKVIYDIKGEINRAVCVLTFNSTQHFVEVYKLLKIQQTLFNIVPFYNDVLAKAFIPFNEYTKYYIKMLGSDAITYNMSNSGMILNEPAYINGVYYSSLYTMIPVYCNINSIKSQSVDNNTSLYMMEIDVSKCSIETMLLYDFKYAKNLPALKSILKTQSQMMGDKNPIYRILNELTYKEETIDSTYTIDL